MPLRTDATGAVPEQDCWRPGRDAEANRSPESSEKDRDSTRSVLGKMVDVPVVRVNRYPQLQIEPQHVEVPEVQTR